MEAVAKDTRATVIPTMSYRDAKAAVDWLVRAFGFERHAVYEENGAVMHAELSIGNGMVMIGQVNDGAFAKYMAQPDETGGRETQTIFVIVADADAHYARAKAAGAEILLDISDKFYGGRDYTCRDPEGHIWSFGTYDPWTAKPA
ncbi:MAG TPA: VOC family protein [Bauldia sp.]|nr:VOC family protein [Bauldia sp.]